MIRAGINLATGPSRAAWDLACLAPLGQFFEYFVL